MTATSALPSVKYTKVAIALHWIIAVLMLYMLFPGDELIEVPRGETMSLWGPTAHASLGILVLILTLVRIAWRLGNPPPPPPAGMPGWQITATAVVHGILYLLMLAIPLFGWFALAPYGAARLDANAVSFFWLFPVNVMPDIGGWTGEVHELTGNLAKILIGIHVLAALKHQFIDKDGLMRRMTFR